MVQNKLHNSLVENLETAMVLATSTAIHSADNGFNGDDNISNAKQKGDGPKIMNTTENDLIKIISYEANITMVRYHSWLHFDILMLKRLPLFYFLVFEKMPYRLMSLNFSEHCKNYNTQWNQCEIQWNHIFRFILFYFILLKNLTFVTFLHKFFFLNFFSFNFF